MSGAGGGGGSGTDYLNEYRNISNKLKKRFLRRPNVSEASDQFSRLAKRLESQEEPQYAAACYLAVAKCEQSIGEVGEVEAYVAAARAFFKAETDITSINCNSLQLHLTDAISSYCTAIKLLEDMDKSAQASGLCLEIGDKLRDLGKVSEAVGFYQRSADLRSSQPGLEYVHSREKVASCLIDLEDYHSALMSLTEIAQLTQTLCGSPKETPTSVYADILASSEILRVLLVLLIDPTPQGISAAHTSVVEKYAWESDTLPSSATTSSGHREDTDSSSSMVCPSFLSEDTFLLLQSVVMSVQLKDAGALAELEDCLVQSALAEMPQQRELLRKLVINSRNW